MIAAILLAMQAAPALPTDWSQLPPLRWKLPPLYDTEMARFVMDEVHAGRCAAATHDDSGYTLRVDMAVLVSPAGTVRTITPRAIGCATVEQYASGLISRAARDNLGPIAGDADGWYRASITFAWQQ